MITCSKRQGSLIDNLNENTRVGERDDYEEEEEEEEEDLWRDNKENTTGAMYSSKEGDANKGSAARDDELTQLEKEVSEIASKLHDFRTRVPKMLERKVEEEVVALRPKDDDVAGNGEGSNEDARAGALVNEEAEAGELLSRLLKATSDLPGMRQTLESSVARLERTIENAEEAMENAKTRQADADDVATPGAGGKTARRHAVATKHVRPSPYLK